MSNLSKKKKCQISCHSDVIYYSIHKLIFYVHFRLQKLKFKYLIDDIAIDIWSYWKFAKMEDIRRKCNPMVDLSKFTSNTKEKEKVEL